MKVIEKRSTQAILLTLNICLSPFTLSSCAMIARAGGLSFKTFITDTERGGLWRKQSNELIPWVQTHRKFICRSTEDDEAIMNYCGLRRKGD